MADLTPEEVIQVIEDGRKCAGADLRGIDLPKADLRGADLSEADLTGANLKGANLTGADLPYANLSEADLTGANLKGAGYNRHTKWPAGFDPEAAGAVLYT